MREQPHILKSIVVAVTGVFAAWGCRLALAPLLEYHDPFITFFPMVFAIAWWGGLRPTLIATILSTFLLAYIILEPTGSLSIAMPHYRFGLAIYVAVALAAGLMGEQLHSANWRARKTAAQAIADREQLRVTLSSIGDGVIATDNRGRVVSLNPVAQSLTGWSEDEARGKPLAEVFKVAGEDQQQDSEELCAKVLRTGRPVGFANHTLLIARDGSQRPIDNSAAPIRDTTGAIRGVVIVFRDVTDKRLANKALVRSERELTDFFDNAAMPMHSLGPDGMVLKINQSELSMLGYTREEVVGRHISEFYADKHAIDEILSRLARGEIIQNCEARMRCKNGDFKDVVLTTSALWEDGKFIQSRCFSRDITENKRAAESLRFLAEASASLAALVDRESALQQAARLPVPYLADWCVVYEVDSATIEYHAHAHVDPKKELLLGDMLHKFPLDWNSNTATVTALRTGESQLMRTLPEPLLSSFTQSDEHRAIVKELHPHAVISVPLKIRDRTIGVIGLVASDPRREYSQREVELAEALALRIATAVDNARLFHAVKEANRHKDEFLAMLAHELRNPLAAIRYAVAVGQMTGSEPEDDTLEIIDRQTQNLANLIEDLLDVSRISRDKITLRREPVDVASIVSRAAATVRPLIDEKRHELILDLPQETLPLIVDPTRTEQIVANLLTNAAKYTKAGGRVVVRARADDGRAVVDVVDTGIGLPPEMLGRVFDLFAQADRTLDRSEGGLGIGLTVARKLAEMQGGSISVASDGLGHGSTFTLRLPLSSELIITEGVDGKSASHRTQGNYKVLVVDDNRDTANACAMFLRKSGHDVHTAYDGVAALDMAREIKPQVIFLDIGLPGRNGYDVVRTLRNDGLRSQLIVAVSGYGQPEDRQRSVEAGFDMHLVKPVHQDALLAALDRVEQKTQVNVSSA